MTNQTTCLIFPANVFIGQAKACKVPSHDDLAMGQNPVPPVNIPIPTKIGPKMGGEFTYQPKWDALVLTHGHLISAGGAMAQGRGQGIINDTAALVGDDAERPGHRWESWPGCRVQSNTWRIP